MKKLVKKNIAAAVTVFAALLTVAALFLGTAAIRQNSDENGESVPFFEGVFSVGQKERLTYFDVADGVSALSKDDVLKYEAKYSYLNTETYYSKLSENERLLYRIYEYAFENSVTSFYVRRTLLQNTAYNDVEVLIFLSLDHPLVEQNFEIFTSFENPEGIKDVTDENEPAFMHVSLPVNSEENFNKKLLALKRAEEIVGAVPEDISEREKAFYLYKELCNFCEYKLYSKSDEPICYVYDALVSGVSHCDGFSNAYSLLLNVAGIPCFEKAHYDEAAKKTALTVLGGDSKENSEVYKTPTGHTWNCFSVYGKFYDADPSYDSKDRLLKRSMSDAFFGFGVPKGFFPEYKTFDYMELTPECADTFLEKPDCEFKTAYDGNIEKELYYALKNTERDYVFIVFSEETTMDDFRKLAQNLCEYADIAVYFGRCPSSPVTGYFAVRQTD